MKKILCAVTTLSVLTLTANAQVTLDYSWENGGTILGSFGNLANPLNVSTGTDGNGNTVSPRTGSSMLQVSETPHSGTPQAYIGVVTDVADGASITASFYGWDYGDSNAAPSLRIWGHYLTDINDINSYGGSASGSLDYTVGVVGGNWSQVGYTWAFNANGGANVGLVIEARLYSTPSTDATASTDYWIDDLSVTAPDGATMLFPVVPEPSTVALLGLGGLALAIRRRR